MHTIQFDTLLLIASCHCKDSTNLSLSLSLSRLFLFICCFLNHFTLYSNTLSMLLYMVYPLLGISIFIILYDV